MSTTECSARVKLALNVHEVLSPTLAGPMVGDLMAAILKGERLKVWPAAWTELLIRNVARHFAPDHSVWTHVQLMGQDNLIPLRVQQEIIAGREPMRYDLIDYPTAAYWLGMVRESRPAAQDGGAPCEP